MSIKPVLNILGAGGHARALIALVRSLGYKPQAIYDENYLPGKPESISGIEVSGVPETITDTFILLASGNSVRRSEWYSRFHKYVYKNNLIHGSVINYAESIGEANQVFMNVVMNEGVRIGNNNILNTASVIEHECIIGDHNHIAVGALVCGRVTIGSYCSIGAGAVIKNNINIADNIIIGAGAVVVKDLHEPGTYFGVPARLKV